MSKEASKVVSFKGTPIPGTAHPDVIEGLEKLLEEARRGEIVAFGYAVVRPSSQATGWRGGEDMNKFLLHSAAALLTHRLVENIDAIGYDTTT